MTEDEAYKVHIQYTFNAFCKIVIRHAAIDKILNLRRRWEREVSLDYLMNEKFVQLAEPEPDEEHPFTVCGRAIPLRYAAPADAIPANGGSAIAPAAGSPGTWIDPGAAMRRCVRAMPLWGGMRVRSGQGRSAGSSGGAVDVVFPAA